MSILVSRRRATFGSWLIVLILLGLGICLFAQLSWLGIVLALCCLALLVWQTDLMVNTLYTLEDHGGGLVVLTLKRGHRGKPVSIGMAEVVEVTHERALYGLWRYLVLTTADGRMITLQPVNPKTWLTVIRQYMTRLQ